jgi:two-component system OmpR family response regulator
MRVLVVEDDADVSAYLRKGLSESGHTPVLADTTAAAAELLAHGTFDVIILDRLLPDGDGLDLLAGLRSDGSDTPAIIVSALGDVDDRVVGLRAGGDDYLTKPFSFQELLARIEAVVRRRKPNLTQSRLTVGYLELDRLSRRVERAGRDIALQPREFKLLEYLMQHAGQVVTRTMLLEGVWDYHFDPQTNVIDVHISRLRAKLDRDFDRPLLHTVRGAGYLLRAPD